MAQQRSSLAELYQTDLERHLFTPRPARAPSPRRPDVPIGARVAAWWKFGWTRWKSALAAITVSF
jgi:hypothetical protein